MDGGEVQAPCHQLKSERCMRPSPPHTLSPLCCAPVKILTIQSNKTPRDLIGQKGRVSARPSWGVGGKYPHPRKVKSCHVMTPIIAFVHQLPFNKSWLNKQKKQNLANHALCLSTRYLACILHVYQYIHINLYYCNNFLRKARRPPIDEWKEPPAHGVPLTVDRLVRPRKVYFWSPAFSSMPPCQNQDNSGVLVASMASTWKLRQQRTMKTSIPVNCPWGSARSCHVAPVHFRSPMPAHGCFFSAHVQIIMPGPPHVIMLRTQAVGMKSLQASEWHPSASTADSLLCHQRVNRLYSMFHFHFHINVHCPSLCYFLGSLQIFSHMLLFPLPLSSSLQLRNTPWYKYSTSVECVKCKPESQICFYKISMLMFDMLMAPGPIRISGLQTNFGFAISQLTTQ